MSAPWYAPALERRDDAAWEIYHENAKRGPHDPPRAAAGRMPRLDLAAYPLLTPAPDAAPAARAGSAPVLSHGHLLRLLAAGGRPLDADDTTLVFVHLAAVTGLPVALAVFDPVAGSLRAVAEDVPAARLAAALPEPGVLRGAGAVVFLAADLGAATAHAGERGYRDALVAIGRHLGAFEAVATLPVTLRSVPLHDRAADDLLFLDGLSRGVLAAFAVVASG
jgi:hypothetical protein